MTIDMANQLSSYLSSRFPEVVVSDFKFLVSGFESEIYTFHVQLSPSVQNEHILRLFTGEGAIDKLRREAAGLSFLQQAEYPVPNLFLQEPNTDILGKPFEIIEKLEGQALWPILATADPHQVKWLLSEFGLLLRQLHKLDWRSLTPNPDVLESDPISLLENVISHYRSLYTKYQLKGFLQVIDWLDTHKHEIAVRPALVHQDFHANNVLLCSDNQLRVIDWTQFAISDYRIDVCWTLLIMGDFGNPDWGSQIFQAYVSDSAGAVEHLDFFNAIVYMKLLASTVIAVTFGPEAVGLRPDAITLTREQLAIYKQLAQRLRDITGLTIVELTNVLETI
jgi:aminoglycoside phosphotransferase (APT) family kinase protein